jgi:outer membrane receptor protein involved in Fe transport
MKKSLRLLLAGWILLLFTFQVHAQNRTTVKGKVSDESGQPIPYASVTVKGSSKGVSANESGEYSIEIPEKSGVRLIVSAIGFEDLEIAPGANAVLKIGTAVSEVVVTAFGVKQKKKALGYATQELSNKELLESKQINVVNALQGRVAGVQVNSTGGGPGQGARILIRGVKGLDPSANNQPLFVIDGIIMDNGTYTENAAASLRGMTNRAADINPDDIESLSILRGGCQRCSPHYYQKCKGR